MEETRIVIFILTQIIFIANYIMALKDENTHSLLGWICAFIVNVNYIIK